MWRYIRDWGLSIGIAAAVFLAFQAFRPKPDLPEFAPDFELVDIEGRTHKLSEYQGQTVVVNFWATWCGPCRTEIPTFNDFATENPEIPVLGISTETSETKVKATAKQLKMAYPVMLADAATANAYDIDSLPTTVVVGPDGRVESVHVGVMTGWQLDMATR
jgi:peroxiredoxin